MSIEIPPAAVSAIAVVFGLLVGSFLNVVIHRVPLGQSVVSPASHCPACETAIRAWDNVPIVSYLWLRGRCRHCGVRIPLRYPAVEWVTGLIFGVIAFHFGASEWTLAYCAFAAALIAAGMIDYDHQIVPDSISIGGLGVALAVIPVLWAREGLPYGEALSHSLVGAFVGGGMLWSVAFVHARISVALGRRFDHWPGEGESLPGPRDLDYWLWFPGLGLGDVKLLAMIGAVIGPVGVLDAILASALAGLLMGAVQAIGRGALGQPFGFAPAIAVGSLATLFLPDLWILELL